MKKKAKYAAITIVAIFALIIVASLSSDSGKESFEKGKQAGQAQDFSDQEVTEETVSAKASDILGDELREVSIDPLPEGDFITISYMPDAIWNEKHAIEKAAQDATDIFSELFPNASVDSIAVVQLGELTDAYGKKSDEQVVRIVMTREEAEKIDWDGFKDLVLSDYRNLERVSEVFIIHPALQKEL